MIHDLRAQIEGMTGFPAMPEMARRILALGRQPDAQALAAIVELDPGIAGQLMRYASSPFFAYRGKLHSIRDAIARVLGVQPALDIALGAAAGKTFKGPVEGPLGRNAVWLHAVYSAALMQALAEQARPHDGALSAGLAYLGGLVHNFGFLLLGHLYPDDIHALNHALQTDPEAKVIATERRLFWTDHTQYGAWLLRKWGLPPEVVTMVHHHHNEAYHGPYADYVRLALVSDRLIQRLEIGDAGQLELPPTLVEPLGMDEEGLLAVFQRLLDARADLDQLAEDLAA